MRILLSLSCLLLTVNIYAQTTKAYASVSDYIAGRYTELDYARIKKKSLGTTAARMSGASLDYIYNVSSSKYRKTSEVQNYWALERNDSLFINCNRAFRTNERNKLATARSGRRVYIPSGVFAYVRFRSPGYLHFKACRANLPGVPPPVRSGDDPIFVEMASELTDTDVQSSFHYLYDLTKNEAIYFNRGVMREYAAKLSAQKEVEFARYIQGLIAAEK